MEILTTSDSAVFRKGSGKSSAYKITGSQLSKLTSYSHKGAAIVILDVAIIDKDIALPVVATDNMRVLFKFGQDFGQLTIAGRAYLGSKACGDKKILHTIQSAFDSARLSKSSKPTKVSVAGSRAYPVYPVELSFNATDPNTNSVGFNISCILAPTKK